MALNERNAGGAHGSAERDPRLERLYREAAREAPPAHLDAAILAAARREVGARPRAFASRLRRWHVPVSIAAVVMVSVSLVILVREDGGDQMVQAPPSTVTTPAEQPAGPATQLAPATAAREAARSQAAAPAPPRRESREDASVPAAASEPLVARSAPDAPPAKARARAMQTKPTEQDRQPVWHGFEKEPPQKWLDRIEELKRQGQAADAEDMLSEFKRRFPVHPLPLGAK